MDSDGWLELFDGHDTAAFAPDEVEALRKFLSEGTGEAPGAAAPTEREAEASEAPEPSAKGSPSPNPPEKGSP